MRSIQIPDSRETPRAPIDPIGQLRRDVVENDGPSSGPAPSPDCLRFRFSSLRAKKRCFYLICLGICVREAFNRRKP